MSDTESEQQPNADAPVDAAQAAEGQGVGKLMGDATPDLEAEAAAAAHVAAEVVAEVDALRAGEDAEASPQTAPPPGSNADRADSDGRRDKLLKGVLLVNLILMGVVLALPDPLGFQDSSKEGPQQPGPGAPIPDSAAQPGAVPVAAGGRQPGESMVPVGSDTASNPGDVDPLLEQQVLLDGLSESVLWQSAARFTSQGQYDTAVEVLLSLEAQLRERQPPVEDTGGIPTRLDAMLIQVRQSLAQNLQMAGRYEESLDWSRKVQASFETNFLPGDYLRMAWHAEEAGDGADMRRNYARFLLSQKLHDTELRTHVPEAYLKLGNSYRAEALRGENPSAPAPGQVPDSGPATGSHGGGGR